VEDTKPAVEWHKFKDKQIAFRGDKILAIVEPINDFPCQAYGLHLLHTMYTSEEAARADALKGIERMFKARNQEEEYEPQPPLNYVDILEQLVAVLKGQKGKAE
jgi:hypothetical protein